MSAKDDHPIRIVPNSKRVRILVNGKDIADTINALTLFEASYPGVQYIPRSDVLMSLLQRTAHKTHCPYKGEASYYSILSGNGTAENAVWSYEAPFLVATQISGYLAFDPRYVEHVEDPPA